MPVETPSLLDTLLEAGCYNTAGHLDHYNGRTHVRLAEVGSGGELKFERGGMAYADKLVAGAVLDVLCADAPFIGTARSWGDLGDPGQQLDESGPEA